MSTDATSEATPTPKPPKGVDVDYKALEEFYGFINWVLGKNFLQAERRSCVGPRKFIAATKSALFAIVTVKTERLKFEVELARQWQEEIKANGIPRAPSLVSVSHQSAKNLDPSGLVDSIYFGAWQLLRCQASPL